MIYYIYALVDPIDEKTAYVGKTKHLSNRYKAHLKETVNRFKKDWIKKLLRKKKFPLIYVLEQTDGRKWRAREKFWIDNLPSLGFQLTNVLHTPGRHKYYSDIQKAAGRRRKRERKLWLSESTKLSELEVAKQDAGEKKLRVKPIEKDYFDSYLKAASSFDVFTRAMHTISKLALMSRDDEIKNLYLKFLHELGKPGIRRHVGHLFGILLVLCKKGENVSFLEKLLERASNCKNGKNETKDFCGWSWPMILNCSAKLY